MRIGVPKEIKAQESRVGLTPAGAAVLVGDGHVVVMERGAGAGAGFDDAEYARAGAELADVAAAWGADLVVKVKEPLNAEHSLLRGQLLFTYLHLAAVNPGLTEALLQAGTTAIAYETVEDANGRLPLLAPMSAVAGSMAATMGAYYLTAFNGGRGVLPGRILGDPQGTVLVIGDGVVGRHAARTAAALGARVAMAGRHAERLPALRREVSDALEFVQSAPDALAAATRASDLVVGAVLRRGERAPHVVTTAMVAAMQPGSVIVDVSIDQGGCVETARPTSHAHPTYIKHGVVHYCVTNMPGAYPRTSTLALAAATLPYVRRLAAQGAGALDDDAGLARGLNVADGRICYRAVAEALGRMDAFDGAATV